MEKTQLKLRVPAELREWIVAKAEKNDRSINYVVMKMLLELKRKEAVNR
ncbi:Arc family DNA-binding protein [Candidatus Thiothrix sp. Deng01]|uniref:Arc family DNA-binding protein n=1 Tax=Candidatus Thiothrix phosphatis TaxID=3112415 RepID=A0ABU6CUQ5_9GAMM|nr:Arc family DNA-binding protein [Candidatus Thiothrix sp. Deng01]MEB4590533.1 Arc family DNA-binding protein [Candidatus Thiothrix sp. Deng01]